MYREAFLQTFENMLKHYLILTFLIQILDNAYKKRLKLFFSPKSYYENEH
jgi:hypothetical protein